MAMTKDQLIKHAEESGLDVDGRWNKDRLMSEMQKAGISLAEGDDELEKMKDAGIKEDENRELPQGVNMATTPVLVKRDIWIESGRQRKGTVVEIPTANARELIKVGAVERADPMPGEE